ncbi:sphingosine N-acyltransferase LAC1 [Nakaseomyces bracarensis]|uniref:sphingosine N-acyltransferase LAC1 n=1 Tax=Nakaseomyces bracarensis TaxID=273131 RepID=UPI00387240ED
MLKVEVRQRPRRASSVGKIDLGDTVPGLGTMHESRSSKVAAKQRHERLTTQNDMNSITKIYLKARDYNYHHTWFVPLGIMIATYTAYFASIGIDSIHNFLRMFVAISYQQPDNPGYYGKGIKDLAFISYHMIFFTFLREFLMDVVIRRITEWLNIKSKHKVKRMMEQMFSIFYYGFSSPFGFYVMYHSDLWYFRTDTMYNTYPDITIPALFKTFYLIQASFWTQQAFVLVLQLEKPRKDHKELCFHHVVTLLLIWSSYVFHFTKMGLAVYITMDVSDFFLSLSKTLNYIDSPLTEVTFGSFVFVWIYMRHYINGKILWSVLTQFRTEGPFLLNFATQQYKCWISLPIVFTLISALHTVNLYWLFLILKILYRIVWQGITEDVRSDDEDSDSNSDDSKKEN